MKFPYGISDFRRIITGGFLYIDRTDYIRVLEDIGDYLLFLRPRRFGKSLLLSVLENYYDIARKDYFDQMFGHLCIRKNPTRLRNHYFVLKWNFSCVDPSGTSEDIKRAFHGHVNACIEAFMTYYEHYLSSEIRTDDQDASRSLSSLLTVTRKAGHSVCLLIDESAYGAFSRNFSKRTNPLTDQI